MKLTFSTCFGAPFFPRPASVYAELLMKRLKEHPADVYLVNTGWTGGAHGEGGKRFDIPVTRRVVSAIVSGELKNASWEIMNGFKFSIPTSIKGVDKSLLNPRNTWKNAHAYDEKAAWLIQQFRENFQKFEVSERVLDAGPELA